MSDSAKKPSAPDFIFWGLTALLILGLGAVALPNFIKARSQSASNACLNNLRQIDAAANQFALEHELKTGAPVHFPDDLTAYIKLNSAGKIPPCPNGGIYHITKVGELPTCTLSTATPAHVLPNLP
ncbi:MAG: hypothetical protein RL616_1772 [Verrucomicrobiota bacterium]|jgi:hypothetical protein